VKKILFLIFIICFGANPLLAQGGVWTWMNGDSLSGSLGNYGVLGIPADSNQPCSRYQAAYWKDKQGNFWVFGGVTYKTPPNLEGNDMWRFNPTTNQWTWMNGPKLNADVNGEFGIKGIPSSLNYPSARGWGVNCWTDTNGMLWLYGGYGSDSAGNRGDLSDLWQYNPNTNQWTWMAGKSLLYERTNYGSLGVYADSVTPGSLQEVKSSWVTKDNRFFTFGGKHFNYFTYGYETINDIWEFSTSTNQWRWVKGDTTITTTGNYGTKGIAANTNIPPGRCSYTKWQDAYGDLYIFGGARFFDTANLNDTWKYDINTNQWTWLNGSNVKNTLFTTPSFCTPDTLSSPPPRLENQTAQSSRCTNHFWNFGGYNYNFVKPGAYNDLWSYNSINNKWTKVFGKDTLGFQGIFGAKTVPNSTNEISARCGVCIWVDNNENLWVFGGINNSINNVNNDIWRFEPDTACINSSLFVGIKLPKPTDSVICAGDTSFIYNILPTWVTSITPNTNISLINNGTTSSFALHPTTTTTYTFTGAEINNFDCGKSDSLIFTIIVLPSYKPNIANQTINICPNDTAIINLDSNFNYTWPNSNNILTNTDTSWLKILSNNNFSFYLVANNNGLCGGIDSGLININISTPGIINIPINSSYTICKGDSVSINLNNTAYQIISLLPNSFTKVGTTITLKPTSTTTYTLILQDASSTCLSLDTFVFTINVETPTNIIIPQYAPLTICNGQSATLNLNNGTYNLSIAPITNVVKGSGNNYIFTPTATTIYTITLSDNSVCSNIATTTWVLTVIDKPIANFTFNEPVYILPNANIMATNISAGASTYNWYINPYIYIGNSINLNYTTNVANEYCFNLVAKNNFCADTITKCINVINDSVSLCIIPNVFSPNGDNKNDDIGLIYKNISLDLFSIYNRWGNIVFETQDPIARWTGVYKGKDCDVGTYYYVVKYTDTKGKQHLLKGDISLVR
jgi:gliding motility-associated-like protein